MMHPASLIALLALAAMPVRAAEPAPGVDAVIKELLKLEQQREPKCYATASRLEDFMYGTPLGDQARFAKNLLQKQWVEWIWRRASAIARERGAERTEAVDVEAALIGVLSVDRDPQGHHALTLNGRPIKINAVDKRQYQSVAYSLRAILAVQQELLLAADSDTLLLDEAAVARLADALDYVTLAALKLTDEQMRMADRSEVEREPLIQNWLALTGQPALSDPVVSNTGAPVSPADLSILRAMIAQKLASYAAYNNVSNQLFMRNLQVYFARSRWPADAAEGDAFRAAFTESMIRFTGDLYAGAEQAARAAGHPSIREADVARFAEEFIPHRINEYEDAIFFPRLPRTHQVEIEAYDMDAFRDPGWHWRYLGEAIDSPDFTPGLQLDPFAAELLTENVAQFGVLILRVAGEAARREGKEEISVALLARAFDDLQSRIQAHASASATPPEAAPIASSANENPANDAYFDDITAATGVDYVHRNSDWLNRQLRSFLRKDDRTGVITIPPAFGGSGVAAEDIDNDGRVDILLLGGRGNQLYRNLGGGRFEDVSERAGIDWRRDDHQPGEPRQPLIADLDNDGMQDIVITYVDDAHRVFRNLGDGRFEDVTERAGLGGKGLVGGPATVFDFDGDGRLDLYIQYFGDYLNGVLPTLARRNFNALPNRLFRNVGEFRFVDVTEGSGVDDTGWGQSVTHTDIDGDGRQDLISGNDFGVNRYFINKGDGHFRDAAADLGTDKPTYTMSIGITDLNRDLRPDLYIASIVTMNKDETYVMPNRDMPAKFNPEKLGNMRVVEANDLFVSTRSETPGYVQSDAIGRGRSSTGWSWDADFLDFDNDGDDDLYVLNGMNDYHVYSSENPYYADPSDARRDATFPDAGRASNVFFENRGGRLENRSPQSGLDFVGNSRSAAYFDVDGDGDLDVVTNDYQGPAHLFRNRSERFDNRWLAVRLVGAPERGVNRDAIGARLVARTATDGQVFREVRGSEGYMSVHPKTQYFGLGKAELVNLSIRWPNGRVQELTDLEAGRVHTIVYPEQ